MRKLRPYRWVLLTENQCCPHCKTHVFTYASWDFLVFNWMNNHVFVPFRRIKRWWYRVLDRFDHYKDPLL